jgi:hypothetical protein
VDPALNSFFAMSHHFLEPQNDHIENEAASSNAPPRKKEFAFHAFFA